MMLLVGWQEGNSACKTLSGGVVICLERGAGLHMAQLMPLPLTVSCFSKIQIGFTFLVLWFSLSCVMCICSVLRACSILWLSNKFWEKLWWLCFLKPVVSYLVLNDFVLCSICHNDDLQSGLDGENPVTARS